MYNISTKLFLTEYFCRKDDHGIPNSSPAPGLLPQSPQPLETNGTKNLRRPRNFSRQKIKSATNAHGQSDIPWLFPETSKHDFLERCAVIAKHDVVWDQIG